MQAFDKCHKERRLHRIKHYGAAFFLLSDPGGILTLDLQNRNLTLYTAKLRSH